MVEKPVSQTDNAAFTNDQRELFERRLADAVEQRVRARLIKFYGGIGAAVIGVVGYIGFNIYDEAAEQLTRNIARLEEQLASLDGMVSSKVDEYIEKNLLPIEQEAEDLLRETEDKAQGMLASAKVQSEKALVRIEMADAVLGDSRHKLAEITEQLANAKVRLKADTEDIFGRVNDATKKLSVFTSEVDRQRVKAENLYAGAGNLADLAASVKELADQMAGIDARVRDIADRTNTPIAESAELVQSKLSTIAAYSAVQAGAPQQGPVLSSASLLLPEDTTVFIQFTELPRAKVQLIGDQLERFGYAVPGEEEVKTAGELAEVRYFFKADRLMAEQLASNVTFTLSDVGYPDQTINTVSFVNYSGRKPKPRTLELWLGAGALDARK